MLKYKKLILCDHFVSIHPFWSKFFIEFDKKGTVLIKFDKKVVVLIHFVVKKQLEDDMMKP